MDDFAKQSPKQSLVIVVSQATWNTNNYKELIGKTAKKLMYFPPFIQFFT